MEKKLLFASFVALLVITAPVWGAPLGIEKTVDTIGRLRIAEDAMWMFAAGFILYFAIRLRSMVEPQKDTFTLFTLTFLAIFVWKVFGVWRRVWAPPFSDALHDIGELLEGISGLLIGVTFLYTYMKLKD